MVANVNINMNDKALERVLKSYANEIKRNISGNKIRGAKKISNFRLRFCIGKVLKDNLSGHDKKILLRIIRTDK